MGHAAANGARCGSDHIKDTVLLGGGTSTPGGGVHRESGLATGADAIDAMLEGADAVYVAFDADVMGRTTCRRSCPSRVAGASTRPSGSALLAERCTVAGAGLTGVTPDPGRPAAGEARRGARSLSKLLALLFVTLAIPAAAPADGSAPPSTSRSASSSS